jgi:FkbM family methyltransferase
MESETCNESAMKLTDIQKDSVRRLLARTGVRIQKAKYLPYSYNRNNYPQIPVGRTPVIFDVGANIGQSSLWFALEFPGADIHAFEPFETIFAELGRRVASRRNVHCHRLALGPSLGKVEVAAITDAFCQTGNLSQGAAGSKTEWIDIDTLDAVSARLGVERIDILKTDTEGHDLGVLQGAGRMLSEGRIGSVLSEATIQPEDTEHTQLKALDELLSGYGFVMRSLFDLHHLPETGRLSYFNALFLPGDTGKQNSVAHED